MAITISGSGITSANIADSAITSTKIADSAVTSTKITDGTIVNADLANTTHRVLQVVSTTASVQYANSTSTWNVKMTANDTTITPSSTSSKILVMVNVLSELQFSNTIPAYDMYRSISGGATTYNLSGETYGFSKIADATAGSLAYSYLDSPATTSAVTYSATMIYAGGGVGAVYIGNNSIASTITVMEIGV